MSKMMKMCVIKCIIFVVVVSNWSLCFAAPIDLSSLSGTVATATSTYESYFPEYVLDGSLGMPHWSAAGWASSTNPITLTVELKQQFLVSQIDLYSSSSNGYPGYYIDYNLYIEANGVKSKVVDAGNLTENSTDYFDKVFFLQAVPVKTIYFEVIGGTHWAHLFEIDVFGPQTPPTATPEPGTMLLMGVGALAAAYVTRKRSRQVV